MPTDRTTLHERCPKCGGTGDESVTDHADGKRSWQHVTCTDCGGTGRVDSPAALARIADLEAEAVRLRGERDAIVGWAVRGAHHVGQFPASGPARRWWAHGADATYYGATAADAILTAAAGGGEVAP